MEIPALPTPVSFDPATTALVVIDMQGDFLEDTGWAAAVGLDYRRLQSVIPVVKEVLDAARARGLLVIFTREGHRPDLSDCPLRKRGRRSPHIGDQGPNGRYLVIGERCHDIIDAVRPRAGEIVVDKPGKGSFYATPMAQILTKRGIRTLLITGITTDVCVHATIVEANDRAYDCVLLEEATTCFDQDLTDAVIKIMRRGTLGWAARVPDLLGALA